MKLKNLLLSFLLILTIGMTSNAQPPSTHPAMQLRRYYADVYTGSSIISYETDSIDSVLVIAALFIEPAQVISLYSYKQTPYNYRNEAFDIYEITSLGYPKVHRALSDSLFRLSFLSEEFDRPKHYNWQSGQYLYSSSGSFSRCYRYR